VLTHQSGFPPALVGLARAEIAEGKDQDARSSLLAVLSRNPDDAAANGELGALESRGQDWSASEKHLSRAWAKDRSNVNYALALSRTYRHLSQPAEALKVLEMIRPATKESSAFHLELAQVYGQLHQTTEAETERKLVSQLQTADQQGLHFDQPKVYVH